MRKVIVASVLALVMATVPMLGETHGPNFLNVSVAGYSVHCHGAGGNSNETYVQTPSGSVGVHFTGPGNPGASHPITPSHPPITDAGSGACVTP